MQSQTWKKCWDKSIEPGLKNALLASDMLPLEIFSLTIKLFVMRRSFFLQVNI